MIYITTSVDKFYGYIGHRGTIGLGVENTVTAFLIGAYKKVWGLECDIRISSDGYFFIMHDDTLKRFISFDNKTVWKYSKKELTNKILTQKFNDKVYFSKITFLEEYLKICKVNNLYAIIEIKYSPHLNNTDISKAPDLINIIKYYQMFDYVIITSFMKECLIKIRKLYPTIRIQLLVIGNLNKHLNDCIKYHFDIGTSNNKFVNPKDIEKFHLYNLYVNVWTVDDKLEAQKLIEMKVNWITSNILN